MIGVEDEMLFRLIFTYLNWNRVLLMVIELEDEFELLAPVLSDDDELHIMKIRAKEVSFIKVGWAFYMVYGRLLTCVAYIVMDFSLVMIIFGLLLFIIMWVIMN